MYNNVDILYNMRSMVASENSRQKLAAENELHAGIHSQSNQSHDLITKLNIYMTYGVQEYWNVNPMLDTITVYTLNDEKMYEQHDIKTNTGEITSKFLEGFVTDIAYIFQE